MGIYPLDRVYHVDPVQRPYAPENFSGHIANGIEAINIGPEPVVRLDNPRSVASGAALRNNRLA